MPLMFEICIEMRGKGKFHMAFNCLQYDLHKSFVFGQLDN